MEPEQQNQSQSKTNDLASSAQPKAPADTSTSSPAPSTPPAAPARPRRPQRTPRVEGSIDVSEPKPPESPKPHQLSSHGETTDPSHPSEPQSQLKVGHGPGQKISAHTAVARSHISMRAASLPQTPSFKPPSSETAVYPQRALSVAGTADTQTQVVEDFRYDFNSSLHPASVVLLCD